MYLRPQDTSFTKDRDDTLRVTGEEWLVKKVGAYLPGAYEEVVDTVGAYVLNDKVGDFSIHVTLTLVKIDVHSFIILTTS